MDNEAFRALVEERAKPKSTKEIAREAVEEEFRTRKRKRRGGGGGGSSSEESGDSDNDDNEKEQKSLKDDQFIPLAVKKKAPKESKYRDRAKERREGKNVDYQALQAEQALLEGRVAAAASGDDSGQMDSVTMSKYLGGDEEHTHLVKGLDVALARKVKREMVASTRDGEQPRKQEAVEPRVKDENEKKKRIRIVKDADEARAFLQRTTAASVSSELGRQVLTHLKRTHLPPRKLSEVIVEKSPAGFAIERTSLTFSTRSDPRIKSRAWEVPLESMQAATRADVDAERNGVISLDDTLIQQIKTAFSEHASRHERQGSSVAATVTGESKQSENEAEQDDDDDEDIFDETDDYVAPSKPIRNNMRTEKASKESKGSIFDGLVAAEPSSSRPTTTVSSRSESRPVNANGNVVFSRKNTAAPSTKSQQMGVSISSYEGGYGEEMDVDFDGRFGDEDDGDERKKKRRKGQTAEDD